MPGEVLAGEQPIMANVGRRTATVRVTNTSVWPVHVGSHFHFFEVNRALVFDREAAYGMRLDLPAGTAVRFEPGDVKRVQVIPLAGERVVHGLNGLVRGRLDDADVKKQALERMRTLGFGNK